MTTEEKIKQWCPQAGTETAGETVVHVPADRLEDVCHRLHDDAEEPMDYLRDLVGVDQGEGCLSTYYQLESSRTGSRVMLRADAVEREGRATLPSVSGLWKTAEIKEREAYDFLGILFTGNPDMRRLFLREDWKGYPLRKDYDMDSNPLNIMLGNPDLENRHSHHFDILFNRALSGQRMYNVGGSFNVHQNSLALGYTYDRTTGVRTITPQTVDGNWHLRFWGGYSTPLDSARRWNLQFNARAAYYNSADLIDGQRSEVGSYYLTPTLKIDYRPSSRLYLALKADAYYQHSVSSREDFETIDLCDFDYGLTAQVELPFDFQLATDLTMYSRRGYADEGMDSDELVWNARLSKRFFKGNLVLMLDGFDLLGNLSNIRRSINAQGRVETWHNVTPRYAMFHAVYRINKQPKNK